MAKAFAVDLHVLKLHPGLNPMIDDVQRFVEIPRELGQEVVLPIRLANRETGRSIEVDAQIAEPGIISSVPLDYTRYLFPEYRAFTVESYCRPDFTWWSPFFQISLNKISESFVRSTTTHGRLMPIEDEETVVLSAGIARSMFEFYEDETATTLCYPISWPFKTPLSDLRRTAVLILGTDSTDDGFARMKIIQSELSDGSLKGVIVRDLLDPPDMYLEEKVAMLAASAAFCVVEYSFASGVIAELSLLKAMRTTVVLLREYGTGASFMQADYVLDSPNIREFTYSMDPASIGPPSLVNALGQGVQWAHARKEEKVGRLDQHLPWREEQIILQEVGNNSWRVRYIREFAFHLANGIGRAIAGGGRHKVRSVNTGLDGVIAVELACGSHVAIVEALILQDVFSEPRRISYVVRVEGGGRHVIEYVHGRIRDLSEPKYSERNHLWDFWLVVGSQYDPLTVTSVAAWFDIDI